MIHLVFKVFENSISITLSVKYLGKLVPVNVRLSYPKTFKSIDGWIDAIVQST